MGGLKLPALLITPIQRLPRYRLLLSELAGLSRGEEQAEFLEVLEDVEVAAELVNGSVEEREAEALLLEIQAQLDSAAPRLLVPARRFVKTGTLHKLLASRRPAKWELRTLFLFTDIILYGKPPRPPRTKVPRPLATPHCRIHVHCFQVKVCCVIPLRHTEVHLLPGQNMLKLACPGEEIFFRSHSHLEIQTWADLISSNIRFPLWP